MSEARLFYSSVVLNTGKVLIAGGEYSSNGTQTITNPNDEYSATAELYDPSTDSWSAVPAVPASWKSGGFPFSFGDSQSTLLPNGNVLLGPVFRNGGINSTIYNVGTNSWIDGKPFFTGPGDTGNQNEASWLKLPDGSILTVSTNATVSQRYLPATNAWVADANLPFALYGVGNEIGAAVLQPNGNGFFIGANGTTAIYTPSGNANPGSWAAGPLLPNVLQNTLDNNGKVTGTTTVTGAAPDGPACVLRDGKILCALTGQLYNDPRAGTTPPGASNTFWLKAKNPQYPSPVSFYIYDPVTQTFGPQINGPTGVTDNVPDYQAVMLALPDGNVLYSNYNSQLYVFNPGTSPLAAGKPAISSITPNTDTSYHLIGTGLNGISTGAAFGDDAQMDTNFPIVRIVDSGGNVRFGRTYLWSSTGVSTGNTPVSTEFTLPLADFEGGPNGPGIDSLQVIANGIASDPIQFAGPIWVDFNWNGTQNGSFAAPFKTLQAALNAAPSYPVVGRTIRIKGPASSPQTILPSSVAVTIIASGGPVTVGQ
jgi:hypothetical protein